MRQKVIGYLRVSTLDQDTEKNEADVRSYANKMDFGRVEFVSEKVSGAKSWKKRKLATVVNELNAGDILIVPELSRLGRSLIEVLEVLNVLKDKSVKVYSVKENFQLNGDDTHSKVMRTMLGLFAEIERDLIIARTKEGLQFARVKGQVLGRPKGIGKSRLDEHKEEIVALIKTGSSKTYLAEKYGVNRVSLWHWLKRNDLDSLKPQL